MPDPDQRPPGPLQIVVMGVSGSGKSTVAAQLAGRLGLAYVDGDDLHPQNNVDKMRAGHPLDDGDRWPWLDRVAGVLQASAAEGGRGVALACSALKRRYRDRLRAGTGGAVRFAFLDVDEGEIERRLSRRLHHFMPPNLLRSQFDALERPTADEADVITVEAAGSTEETVADIADRLGREPAHASGRKS